MRERHLGGEPGEPGASHGARAGKAEILIDDDDPFGGPAEVAGLAGERVLPVGRFAIVLDLGGTRLAQVDDGLAGKMARRDLGALIHGSPPSPLPRAYGPSGARGTPSPPGRPTPPSCPPGLAARLAGLGAPA